MTTEISHNGFTLIELLVVMAILGILMGLVVPKVGRMMDEAKEHQCRNNLKQLHTAVMSHVNDKNGRLPYAMSYEIYDIANDRYYERRGWIAWMPPGGRRLNERWPDEDSQEDGMVEDGGMGDPALFGIKNGSLYPYMNQSIEHYACPLIKREKGDGTYRTYAMNRFFRSPRNPSWDSRSISGIGSAEYFDSHLPEAAKLLLFAEVEPTVDTHTHSGADAATGSGNDEQATDSIPGDCCIGPTQDTSSNDNIYTVHRSPNHDENGNMIPASLAIFMDGHIEKVMAKNSRGENTAWYLTRGLDPETQP